MELDKFKWETLDHPPYSPDMSPCDFHVFDPLKKHLKGKRFNSDDVLKDTVKNWVSSQPQEFWEQKESCGLFISGIVVLRPMCIFGIKDAFVPTVSFRTFSFDHPLYICCVTCPFFYEEI
ncbi:histone-lysine N-methyltransferase SETMAR [Trichonephila clavipes]|nr:histone-lysine N-methyltransferase SETMAR [Trichonephila clavipes]